ncbi:MAG: iron-containing alcohol dehydrogenase [Geminicoccaceae bacterium]|nr:iron-containing alcohol dehydrogenase [Geminicoccaceae bacterium]
MPPADGPPNAAERSAPRGGWTALIDDIVAGRWVDPATGEPAAVPYGAVVIQESLEGAEADLVHPHGLGDRLAVVADEATWEAMGRRVAGALGALGGVETVILERPHADLATAADLKGHLEGASGVVAVGSGTVNDLCKYVTAGDGRPYCVFGTAASMNGYTSTTASMTLESGLKVSLPAHAPRGFFVDLDVSAAAPPHLAAAGFGDCLCRSVAQIDWWLSHRLLGTYYLETPYLIELPDEAEMNARAGLVGKGEVEGIGYLYRVLTLCGLGIAFTGVSNHGSMGEHQISHYIDCFARERHPGTLHGQQVGVASLTMARLQQQILAMDEPPTLRPTRIDPDGMERRMSPEIAAQCLAEYRKKALDGAGAERLNRRLRAIWPELRRELLAFAVPVDEMERLLRAAGGPVTAAGLGVPLPFYREAVLHCREMRDRYSMLDLADDAGLLEDFVAGEG